jgi:hypothetical protein
MNGSKKRVLQEDLIPEFSEQIKQIQANKTEKEKGFVVSLNKQIQKSNVTECQNFPIVRQRQMLFK